MSEHLCEFIALKIADVEKAIRIREDSQRVWISGANESWKQAAAIHSRTAGLTLTRKERIETAAKESRILVKLRRELELFKEVLDKLKAE